MQKYKNTRIQTHVQEIEERQKYKHNNKIYKNAKPILNIYIYEKIKKKQITNNTKILKEYKNAKQ